MRTSLAAIAKSTLALVTSGSPTALVTDLYQRLWAVIAGYDSGSNSNRMFEISPLNLQVLEESLADTTNVAADTNYPSDDGLVMMGYRDFSLTGKIIDADDTVTLTVWGTNDEDSTPANRDWIQLYGYRTDTNTVVNSIACASTTVTFAWDFDNCNYKYIRVKVDVGTATNTIILKIRRKAL